MDITPPRLPLDSLLKRRPMTVYTVSCPPAEAVARCAQFWRSIGIKRESTTMCKRFADIGWSGTEVTVMPGQVENRKRSRSDFFPDDLSDVPPSWLLGGLVVYLTSKAVRAQLRHLNKTTIIIAAHSMPDAEHACTELWCFPWDTAIQRVRPGKDPFARVFEYLHTALHQQGVLLAPPRLVDGEELPRGPPLPRQHRPDAGQLPRSRHQVPPVEGAVMTPVSRCAGFSIAAGTCARLSRPTRTGRSHAPSNTGHRGGGARWRKRPAYPNSSHATGELAPKSPTVLTRGACWPPYPSTRLHAATCPPLRLPNPGEAHADRPRAS